VKIKNIDTDEDSIRDLSDNCPNASNPDQADTDGDGFGDVCDCEPDDPTIHPDSNDTALPQVMGFSAVKIAVLENNPVQFNYTVSDNTGLARVELWRATDNGGQPGTWGPAPVTEETISGTNAAGTLSDHAPAVGKYWYGIHVVDEACNVGKEQQVVMVRVLSGGANDDGDGYINSADAFPLDPTEWADMDADGIGDNSDTDADGDGFDGVAAGGPDTDDLNPAINPDAEEICGDSLDNNCDGDIDEGCGALLPTGKIPDTGQITSYTNIWGEDSDYTINPPSYTKLDENGADLPDSATQWAMIRDNVTGLIWENKTDDGGIHDKDNAYTWYDPNTATNGGNAGTPGNGTDTQDFIDALNAAKFGGFQDWRLPRVKELSWIVNANRYSPAINTVYFQNTMSTDYWSSTTYAN
jgi:hypothetical protein